MNRYSIILISIFTILVGCKTQTAITRRNQNKPNIKIMLESKEITLNVDSLKNNDFKSINSQLQTAKSQSQIEKLLVGKWIGHLRTRANEKDEQIIVNSIFEFTSTYNFREIVEKDTSIGEYLIQTDSISNLVLKYDKPLYPYPKEMLEEMTEQEKEQITYHIRLMNIFEINSKNLIFFATLPIIDYTNPSTITHSRLIVEEYTKK